MINKIGVFSSSKHTPSFCGISLGKVRFNSNLAKLEKKLMPCDSVKIFSKTIENNELTDLLKKTVNFVLSVPEEKIARIDKKSSKIAKLVTITSQYDSPEFITQTKQLIKTAKNLQKVKGFYLTNDNFPSVATIEKLNIKILKKDGATKDQMLKTIQNVFASLSEDAENTANKMKHSSLFYKKNADKFLVDMYRGERLNQIIYKGNDLLYGSDVAESKLAGRVKEQVIDSYEHGMRGSIESLVDELAKELLDKNLSAKDKFSELSKYRIEIRKADPRIAKIIKALNLSKNADV